MHIQSIKVESASYNKKEVKIPASLPMIIPMVIHSMRGSMFPLPDFLWVRACGKRATNILSYVGGGV